MGNLPQDVTGAALIWADTASASDGEEHRVAKFVLASLRAGATHDSSELNRRAETARAAFASLFAGPGDEVALPGDSRALFVFNADADLVDQHRQSLPDGVVVEHVVTRQRRTSVALPPSYQAPNADPGDGTTFPVAVRTDGRPQTTVTGHLLVDTPNGPRVATVTGPTGGDLVFPWAASWSAASLTVVPASGYWAQTIPDPLPHGSVHLRPLGAYQLRSWWHRLLGIPRYLPEVGAGIRVGLIDSGVDINHPALGGIGMAGSFYDGVRNPQDNAHVGWSGSFNAGLIAGRPPSNSKRPGGISPGAVVTSVRVFQREDGDAQAVDVAAAIDYLVSVGIDLICVTCSGGDWSDVEHDAVTAAVESGVVVLAAAGLMTCSYPAGYPEVLSVAAVGADERFPDDAPAVSAKGRSAGKGGVWPATFAVTAHPDLAAPGVAIVGPVPVDGRAAPYAAADGNGVAVALATATAAAILAEQKEWATRPAGPGRSAMARRLVVRTAHRLGLPSTRVGDGLPRLKPDR